MKITDDGTTVTIETDGSSSSGDTSCQANAIAPLKQLDPHDYSLYQEEQKFFTSPGWWQCQDFVSDLNTAVHETTHIVSGRKRAYVMADGTQLPRVSSSTVFFPPSEISAQIDPSWHHAFYIRDNGREDQPSSVKQFAYMLDEMNANSVGLISTNKLIAHKRGLDDSRDGAFAFMHYLELYINRAKAVHPETWSALKASQTRSAIQRLWAQAQAAEKDACRKKVPGSQDQIYLTKLCATNGHEALAEILGANPVCLKVCKQ